VNVSCSQSQLALSLFNEKARWELLHQVLYDPCSSVRRIVFNDEDVKILFQGENLPDDLFDILLLVVCGNDD